MKWKGNYYGHTLKSMFNRSIADNFYEADGLDTAHANNDGAAVVVSAGTIPANTLEVGDQIVFEGAVYVTSRTSGNLTVAWTFGTHPAHLSSGAVTALDDDFFVWNYTARVKAISPSLDFADYKRMAWMRDAADADAPAPNERERVVALGGGVSGPPGGAYAMYQQAAHLFKVMLTWSVADAANSATVIRNDCHVIRTTNA